MSNQKTRPVYLADHSLPAPYHCLTCYEDMMASDEINSPKNRRTCTKCHHFQASHRVAKVHLCPRPDTASTVACQDWSTCPTGYKRGHTKSLKSIKLTIEVSDEEEKQNTLTRMIESNENTAENIVNDEKTLSEIMETDPLVTTLWTELAEKKKKYFEVLRKQQKEIKAIEDKILKKKTEEWIKSFEKMKINVCKSCNICNHLV
eukprot:TRINITY_DN678_c0_g1_i15.p1 TRINITY_DN678_c0_g1~~TRINITY_DN678_c0_g1_i15.p1  ORF type:complete len:213 (+),score=31.80 TRINITY_DN678_c0_g1_i15:29-640(+)